jgi:hypothetical protein
MRGTSQSQSRVGPTGKEAGCKNAAQHEVELRLQATNSQLLKAKIRMLMSLKRSSTARFVFAKM